jgi:hypothetical protein
LGVGVARGVGLGVGWDVGLDDGVGPTTTGVLAVGDGSIDAGVDGATTGLAEPAGVGVVATAGDDGASAEVVGEPGGGLEGDWLGAAATPRSGWLGATNPAVSATVARMRFRSPMATTRRAR